MARDKTRIAPEALDRFLREHPSWRVEGEVLSRTFEFEAFAAGIRFVDRLAIEADRVDHHPDIDIRYTKVRVALTTHDAGGLTSRDTTLAARAEALAIG